MIYTIILRLYGQADNKYHFKIIYICFFKGMINKKEVKIINS